MQPRTAFPRVPLALPALLACVSLLALLPTPTHAAGDADRFVDALLGSEEDDVASALLREMDEEAKDYDQVRVSCLSMLAQWEGVRPSRAPAGETQPAWQWKEEGGGIVMPLADGSIGTLLDVPENGTYRLSLRHRVDPRLAMPVTLGLQPQRPAGESTGTATGLIAYADAGPALTHIYGRTPLPTGQTGREIEKKWPIRFEREFEQVSQPSQATWVWEYWDVELKKGVYRATLATPEKRVRAHALFLSRSKDFRPSFGDLKLNPSLGRIYMRFRVAGQGAAKDASATVSANLTYHWRGRSYPNAPPGADPTAWGWNIGRAPATPKGEWSAFVDATDAIIPGPGPWSTCNLSFGGVRTGTAHLQLAWYPHEAAVMRELRTGIGEGRGRIRVPHGHGGVRAIADQPVWGMWRENHLARFETEEDVLARYFEWAEEAARELGLKEPPPRIRHLRIYTGCGVTPAHKERAAEMLASLGINWIGGAPQSVIDEYGLWDETTSYNTHDADAVARGLSAEQRLKRTKHKMGDEIGTYRSPSSINADPGQMRAFRAYLAAQAAAHGTTAGEFFGVDDVRDLPCIGAPPANPGRFERRLYYHSHRFCHLAIVPDYRRAVERFHELFPNIHVYNNYSPHPPFLTGTTMNHSDWFLLCRNQAQTLGWAEDWAYLGSWSLGTDYQCTSFFAALVACAARKHGYPGGFYVGVNCGGGARKLFACVAQGLTWLELYSWGPIDGIAEGSNAWSEHRDQYKAVLTATAALGPADTLIGEGRRQPARTAILYNRSHEIWQGGTGRLNHDWMWTFIGLMSEKVPVDFIIEEDLVPEALDRYDVLYLGGFNLDARHLANVRGWLEADEGHLLIGTGGSLTRDIYNDPLAEAEALFGASQTLVPEGHPRATDKAVFEDSALYPAMEIVPHGMKYALHPTTGAPIAHYDGGDYAAVMNRVGKGRALLIGFHAGYTFRGNGKHESIGRQWLNAPVLRTLGRQRVEFDYHLSEATLFEHPDGAAVLLNSFSREPVEAGHTLSVRLDRPVASVESALRGPLEWEKKDGRIEIKAPPLAPVDVVILTP